MLLGLACREALARGLQLRPLWSLYSPHGPVFRVMVTVDKAGGREDMLRMQRQLGFVLHDSVTGEPQTLGWDALGSAHRWAAAAGDRCCGCGLACAVTLLLLAIAAAEAPDIHARIPPACLASTLEPSSPEPRLVAYY